MRVVIQRVKEAGVTINGSLHSQISQGLMVLVGIEEADTQDDIEWLAKKIVNLRIFDDQNGVMNLSLADIEGQLLLVSQFTLHAMTAKGNRPSYIKAAKPEVSVPIYNKFIERLQSYLGKKIETGIFGAEMQVSLINDGPVTITIDTKRRE